MENFEVQFWGVRGSIPCPGNSTVRYGGNTSCIEMRVGGKKLIFDGGTGLRVLSESLESQPIETHLFFTHYHWDHIQGVPFFKPAFAEGNKIHIYGVTPDEYSSMEAHFHQNVLHNHSPVPIPPMKADIKFYNLSSEQTFNIEDITIETRPLNHPNGATGYRVMWQNKAAFYCSDTEHYGDRLDPNVLYLARDANIFIYDSMYTDEEYYNPKFPKKGWGHSTWQEAVKIAQAANVQTLVIFHHDPIHHDDFLDKIELEVIAAFPNAVMAKEGLILSL